jgi:hypothetical protein
LYWETRPEGQLNVSGTLFSDAYSSRTCALEDN